MTLPPCEFACHATEFSLCFSFLTRRPAHRVGNFHPTCATLRLVKGILCFAAQATSGGSVIQLGLHHLRCLQ